MPSRHRLLATKPMMASACGFLLLLLISVCLPTTTRAFMVAPSASSLVASLSRATSTGHSSSDTSERMVQQQQGSSTRISSSPSSSRMITRSNRAKRSRAVMAAVASEAVVAGAAGGTETRVWKWRGYDIRYKVAGEGVDGPPMVLIHGFGGNADHWRKNMSVLAEKGPVYAIDLLGYGFSSKPDPGPWEDRNSIYSFDTWSAQVRDFAENVVGKPVFVVCNSVGGVAGLQAAVDAPKQVLGVVLFNISLRMLHTEKQPPLGRPFVTGLQYVLRETAIGPLFFSSVAKSKAVSNILKQCYGDPEQVTEELVECILTPGLEPGAVKVFLDFISYSGGPLPEDLLAEIKVPVVIAWGDQDPWEPIEQGRVLAESDSVEEFIVLPGAGHCPQDEAPQLTDPVVLNFVEKHYVKKGIAL